MKMIINNPFDLWESISGVKLNDENECRELIKKAVYKGTSCGAWVTFHSHDEDGNPGVTVGSIVEGADQETDTHFIKYPFDSSVFWDALTLVEEEAQEIWDNTHGCEDCGLDGAINPDCPTCHGEGEII